MALDPNEIVSQGWLDKADDFEGIEPPSGVDVASGKFYAYYRTYRDGRRVVEWYQRGTGSGGKDDPIMSTTQGTVKGIRDKWEEDQRKDQSNTRAEQGGVKPTNVYIGTNPQTGKPTQVSEWPDGHKSYDDTQVPAAQTGTAKPPDTKDEGGRRYQWQPNPGGPNAGGQWVDVGPAPLSAAEQAQQPQTTRTPDKDNPGYTIVTTKNPQTGVTESHYENAQGQTVAAPPGKSTPHVQTVTGSDGKAYTRVTTTSADGKSVTVTNYGPDGKQVGEIPGSGPSTPRTAGPDLPTIVLGHSQAAAQQYKQLLQQGVASGQWSQQWADQRWGEFMQTAQLAVQEAATQQRDIESTRNAQINVATSRATYGQNALKDAMAYAEKINGLAPAGSQNLGGQAFATMMGLSMLMEARSGLDAVSPTSTARSQIPQVTTSTIANADNLQATRAQVAAANQQYQAESAARQQPAASASSATQPAATTARPSAQAAPAQNAGTGTGEPPARGAIPAQPTPQTTAATKPMYRVDLGDELVYYDAAQHPEMATASGVTLIDAPATWSEGKREPKVGAPSYAKPGGGDIPAATPQPSDQPPGATPDYGQPGMRVLPQPDQQPQPQTDAAPATDQGDPSVQYGTPATMQPGTPIQVPGEAPGVSVPYPSTAGAESYAPQQPPGGYAVLQPYMQQQTQAQPHQQQPAQQDQGMPLALLHAQAASIPFWRMTPQQVEQYRAAGVPENVIQSPGRMVA